VVFYRVFADCLPYVGFGYEAGLLELGLGARGAWGQGRQQLPP
jgi:hypothetical protein